MITLDDLLNALESPEKKVKLENNRDTWSRIGAKDDFAELGLSGGDLEDFLKEWMDTNDYNNI